MAEACGKIILFGEHAVVYGYPGIALPLQLKTRVKVTDNSMFSYSVDRILYEKEKEKLAVLLDFLFMEFELTDNKVNIYIESDLPMSSGLGSSAALSVSLIRGLSDYYKLGLDNKKINEIAFECEKFFHGTPSGIDNTVITYQKPVFFKNKKIELIKIKPLILVIADSGERPNTSVMVKEVREKYEKNKNELTEIFEEIGKISETAKSALEEGNKEKLGNLMTENHSLLKKLDVSNTKLDALVETAVSTGAYGAKLCGAGRGGNVAALVDENSKEEVRDALQTLAKKAIIVEVK